MDPPISADVESSNGNCSESKASTRLRFLEMVNTVAAESEVSIYCFNVYDVKKKCSEEALTVTRKEKPLSWCFERTISECKDEYSKLH